MQGKRHVLLTGAAGFLGSHLAEALLKQGCLVIGVDNFFRGKREYLPDHEDFIFVEHDLTAPNTSKLLAKLMEEYNVDTVIHYAAINGTKYFYDMPFQVLDKNVKMTINILEAIQRSNSPVKLVVYASSSEVYGEPMIIPTPESHPLVLDISHDRDCYAASKVLGEFYVKLSSKEYGYDYLILRIFNTYGPRMDTSEYGQVIPEFIRKLLLEKEFTIIGPGTQTRCFCYVDDHVRLVLKLMYKARNDVFNVGSDEEVTILELAKIMHELVGRPFRPKILPPRPGDRMRRKPDITKLIMTVNDRPRIPLREGLRRTIEYYAKKWNVKVKLKQE